MTTKADGLAAAKAALHELEKHGHAVDAANTARHKAHAFSAETGDPSYEAVAEAALQAAIHAHAESGVTQRDIDIAAQAVLDAQDGE